MSITKPILAADLKNQWDKLVYPVYGTCKLDGIRSISLSGKLVSRTFKTIQNKHIRETLEAFLPKDMDCDGELISGANFQETTHAVMERTETPDFQYYMFDLVSQLDTPYLTRIENMKIWYETLTLEQKKIVVLVLPTKLNNRAEVEAYEQECLDSGFEGVILRTGDSPYKSGRSTLNEGYLIKVKRFEDSECEILGFEELMNNNNVATKDNFGRSERSSHKANLSGAGVLGCFQVRDIKTGQEFSIGTGLDAAQRKLYYDNFTTMCLGKIAKYKFFSVGVKDLPRHPVFLGFRSKEDMSD
jgi:DNA ligase-1